MYIHLHMSYMFVKLCVLFVKVIKGQLSIKADNFERLYEEQKSIVSVLRSELKEL